MTEQPVSAFEDDRPPVEDRGWYLDPSGTENLRYWNGATWGDDARALERPIEDYLAAENELRRSATVSTSLPELSPPEAQELDTTETAGYVFAVFGGWIGILFGLALIARGSRQGVWVLIISIVASIIWTVVLFAALAARVS